MDGETHHTALKRKYQEAMEENQQLRELFNLMHERPAKEASEVYKRLRANDDPLKVLQVIKQADLLLPATHRQTHTASELFETKAGPQGDTFI